MYNGLDKSLYIHELELSIIRWHDLGLSEAYPKDTVTLESGDLVFVWYLGNKVLRDSTVASSTWRNAQQRDILGWSEF